ncbi:HFL103Cp [Eremothecium sinecaudum]|uniref:HFL103Cp n=1 Tax=Eremothecium sinecaudum TaxID=45286 RepID=A0A109V036_9SACH|nr:HFL103Cp [Eremothecium sinecaudum]AMD21753.1 HFL103Cp [Eremothecium sinecaudum]
MGLLSIIKKQKAKDKELRSLVLGLDNSGKTTLVYKLLHPDSTQLPPITPTVGFQIHTLPMGPYNLQLWDIGGQSTLRPFWENYFDSTDLLLWCIDGFATDRLPESHRELCTILAERDRLGLQCAVIVLINKTDLLEDSTKIATVCGQVNQTLFDQLSPAIASRVTLLPCSAITGANLDTLPLVIQRIYSEKAGEAKNSSQPAIQK